MQIAGSEAGRAGLVSGRATPWGRPSAKVSRALSRHHRERLAAVRRERLQDWARDLPRRDRDRFVGRIVTTPCACSCWMCCNPRHAAGNAATARTRQERAAMLDMREAMASIISGRDASTPAAL